ncbi:SagB/ThcOx family dehydrogenase [Vitiosangium sp. GDMCC 1.1324]|uniref:SagB/ThcOx family dehydrogenase n=1 Tax=Vitiosangium sp. (strain GDMCC 1.1324) TaxID=2138576 RepID=UPI00130D7A50|nr:SagB/ThcOx family dehydrogenase [Vitiosangium sp. GDMCC 1.1324]
MSRRPRTPVPQSELEGKPWIRSLGGPPSEPPVTYSLAEQYHEASKYHRALMVREPLDVRAALAIPRRSERTGVPLPPPSEDLPVSLGQVLRKRRSIRHFQPARMPLQVLADLLFYTAGSTGEARFQLGQDTWRRSLRTYPSGGALYSVELFVIPRSVDGLDVAQGVYCYNSIAHCLVPVDADKDTATAVVRTTPMHPAVLNLEHSQVVLALVGVLAVENAKYARRGYRFVLQESGHMAQNALLTTTALGLGGVVMGAFFDDEANRMLRLDGVSETVLYMIPVGVPAPGASEEGGHGG